MLEIQIQNLAFPVAVPPGIGVPQSLLSILDSITKGFGTTDDILFEADDIFL